ncbi:DUF2975 domain-containing protein [Paenibacillus xanthanilyticus]|uniref:DUF2975 domain-containing protein n=1 Tax=Paenibacillus xanthanilyticus TaxID=1783531 RepID=A0ABV8K6C9_9BACL
MKRGATFFLKAVVIAMAIPIAALCFIGLPSIANEATDRFPAIWLYPVFIGIYAAALPYFIALHQAFQLLRLIDRNQAFSENAISRLKKIRNCAAAISVLFAAIMPFLLWIAQDDDAPGLAALGLIIIFASAVIGVFAFVLQRVWQSAIAFKSENDAII